MNKHENEFSKLVKRTGLSTSEISTALSVSHRTFYRYKKGQIQCDQLKLDKLRSLLPGNFVKSSGYSFKFIDLFAGIGGLRRPFEGIGGKCVFTAEWDRFCKTTYEANFPVEEGDKHIFAEDIRPHADDPETIPKHDVLLAGFPCQPFSIAGVSKKNALGRPHGFMCDTQGTLFYDVAKIIDHHRPKAFLLENVKNLERHDGGKTFATIMNVLENELGYKVKTRVIDSSPWVPQKRERIFIVGFIEDTGFDFDDMIIPKGSHPTLGSILDLDVPEKYTLTEHLWNYLKGYKEKHRKAGNGFGYSLFGPGDVARTLSARYYKDGSEILIDQPGKRPRRLTPRECARLMGFDGYNNSEFVIPVSDTQSYRQFGNSVVVPVVKAVADVMKPCIETLVDDAEGGNLRSDFPIPNPGEVFTPEGLERG